MIGSPSLLLMPLKIIGDYREILVDIFFAIIITIGFDGFIHEFFLLDIISPKLESFDISILLNRFSAEPSLLFNMFFFFAAYFWVISHWIFYHELIEKYPYYNSWKFFVDITLFSIMFVIINISYSAYDIRITPLFFLLVAIWYFFACLWHLSDKILRPVKRYLGPHIKRVMTYSILLVLLYDPLSVSQIIPWYRDGIMVGMIVAMLTWNVHRLSRFVRRDLREYRCDYIRGYPGWSSQCEGGILTLERYPMKHKIGVKKKDTIRFNADGDSRGIIIPAENIINVDIKKEDNEQYTNDLILEIEFKDENKKNVKLVLNLSDEVINGVKKGIKEMCEIIEK
jgi:hypothetical protein